MNEEPPALATAREAMGRAAGQARRAAEVLGRLRRGLEPPANAAQPPVALDLGACVREALHLLQPEMERRGVAVRWRASEPVVVQADPVAIDQMRHLGSRRFSPEPTVVTDELAEALLDDLIQENPTQNDELALLINRVNQVRRKTKKA